MATKVPKWGEPGYYWWNLTHACHVCGAFAGFVCSASCTRSGIARQGTAFLEELSATPEPNDEQFRAFIERALQITGKSEQDFANLFGVSRPTVTRWKDGKVVPHTVLRPSIIAALRREVERLNEVGQ